MIADILSFLVPIAISLVFLGFGIPDDNVDEESCSYGASESQKSKANGGAQIRCALPELGSSQPQNECISKAEEEDIWKKN